MVKLILAQVEFEGFKHPVTGKMYLRETDALKLGGLETLSAKEKNKLFKGQAFTKGEWHNLARRAERATWKRSREKRREAAWRYAKLVEAWRALYDPGSVAEYAAKAFSRLEAAFKRVSPIQIVAQAAHDIEAGALVYWQGEQVFDPLTMKGDGGHYVAAFEAPAPPVPDFDGMIESVELPSPLQDAIEAADLSQRANKYVVEFWTRPLADLANPPVLRADPTLPIGNPPGMIDHTADLTVKYDVIEDEESNDDHR